MSAEGAWRTCALLALLVGAGARLYERCELAADLQRLGVRPEHISTWVCIAFHESRFDTSAYNPYSGDHGLLQISELYWCGPGNVCGVPCSAFRDDDISDDIKCALHIYEEHTALQGDGFLAWVVYAQHCKHNTKKYLVDCDASPKNVSNPTTKDEYDTNTQTSKSSYLESSSVLRGRYGNEIEMDTEKKINRINWLDFKVQNIDQLSIPKFQPKKVQNISVSLPKSTTVATFTSTFTDRPKLLDTGKSKSAHNPRQPLTSKWTVNTNSITELDKTTTVRPNKTLIDFNYSTTTKTLNSRNFVSSTILPTKIKPLFVSSAMRPLEGELASRTTASRIDESMVTTPQLQAWDKSINLSASRTTNTHPEHVNPDVNTLMLTPSKRKSSRVTSIFDLYLKPSKRNLTYSTHTRSPSTTIVPSTPSRKEPWFFTKTSTNFVSALKSTTAKSVAMFENPFTTTTSPTNSQKPATTPSIFDLYLNPTKRTLLPPYGKNTGFPSSKYKIKIFSDGTTSTSSPRGRNNARYL